MCGLPARGLWIDLISYMHEGEPYGHLTIDGVAPSETDIASLVACPLKEVRKALTELKAKNVCGVTEAGVIFSRRMVRDKAKSDKDRENGKTGGNPKILAEDKEGVNPPDNPRGQKTEERIDPIGSARASAFTEGSKALASAFWKALGFEHPIDIPPEFAGVDWRALEWEAAGWSVDMIAAEAKRTGPAKPLSYHEKVFATAHAKLHAPLPKVEILEPQTVQVSHGKSQVRPGVAEIAGRYADHFESQPGSSIEGGAGTFLRLSRQ